MLNMFETENKRLVRNYFEEVTNQGDLEAISKYIATDFVDHDAPSGLMMGIEGVRETITLLRTAFPDFHATIEDIIAEGDKVVVRNIWHGTHQGSFLNMSPTGKQVTMKGIVIWRIQDGKIVERWATIDRSQVFEVK
ncbi:MAG TPA: ester cyclase [Allocoleopsis sp.]